MAKSRPGNGRWCGYMGKPMFTTKWARFGLSLLLGLVVLGNLPLANEAAKPWANPMAASVM